MLSSGWLASYVGQSEVPALITSLFCFERCVGSCNKPFVGAKVGDEQNILTIIGYISVMYNI